MLEFSIHYWSISCAPNHAMDLPYFSTCNWISSLTRKETPSSCTHRMNLKGSLSFYHGRSSTLAIVSRSTGCFGCYVTCPNAVSSRVIHLVFHRHQHNCSSSLDSIKLVYQHPLERRSAATDSYVLRSRQFEFGEILISRSSLRLLVSQGDTDTTCSKKVK
jgi:hypothetical protein